MVLNLIDDANKERWTAAGAERLSRLRRRNDSLKQEVIDYPTTGPLGSNVETRHAYCSL